MKVVGEIATVTSNHYLKYLFYYCNGGTMSQSHVQYRQEATDIAVHDRSVQSFLAGIKEVQALKRAELEKIPIRGE